MVIWNSPRAGILFSKCHVKQVWFSWHFLVKCTYLMHSCAISLIGVKQLVKKWNGTKHLDGTCYAFSLFYCTYYHTNIKGGYIFKLRHHYMCKYVPMSQKKKNNNRLQTALKSPSQTFGLVCCHWMDIYDLIWSAETHSSGSECIKPTHLLFKSSV